MKEPLKLYSSLASWWPLLSDPADYEEEAHLYSQILQEYGPKTLLELGSGGGNNASHMKKFFQMTLVDASPGMLEVSKQLNPECEHFPGDMRSFRLDRQFDAVFIHDAVMYMTSAGEVKQAIQTAFVHCKPQGVVLIIPDFVRETFAPETKCGGHDGESKSLRYLEWTYDPDPTDSTVTSDFVYMLREGDQVSVEQDRHICGIFSTAEWLSFFSQEGFEAKKVPLPHSKLPPDQYAGFVGIRSR